jgi:hypothetical protein
MSNVIALKIDRPVAIKHSGYDYANLKVFTKSQVNGLTKHLSGLRFKVADTYNTHDVWTAIFNRAKELGLEIDYSYAHGERLTFTSPRKITAEQSKFGKAWLKDFFFNLKGQPRKGKRTEYVSDRVLNIAKSVSRFEFVGVQILAAQGWYPCQAVPIYRAYNRKGQYFDYAPVHWGQPIIMES